MDANSAIYSFDSQVGEGSISQNIRIDSLMTSTACISFKDNPSKTPTTDLIMKDTFILSNFVSA